MDRKKIEAPVKLSKIPSNAIHVRILTKDDISGVVKVAIMYRRAMEHPDIPYFDRRRRKLLEKSIDEKRHLVFVAEIDGKIVGFFDVRYYEDWFRVCLHIHIEHMFISGEQKDGKFIYKMRGIGSKLLRWTLRYFIKNYLYKYHQLFFYTEGNPLTLDRLMQKNGFVKSPQAFYFKKVRRGA